MRRNQLRPLPIAITLLVHAAIAVWSVPIEAQEQSKTPVKVIFDTDMQSDVDDVGAMAVLHSLADHGEIKILGTMVSQERLSRSFRAQIRRGGEPPIA